MRISDWSSDVCSSDLSSRSKERHLPTTGNKTAHGGREQLVTKISEQIVKVNDVISVDEGHGIVVGYAIVTKVREDRKSVVSGKSVSVRVALGGRRIIKTTRKTQSDDNIII